MLAGCPAGVPEGVLAGVLLAAGVVVGVAGAVGVAAAVAVGCGVVGAVVAVAAGGVAVGEAEPHPARIASNAARRSARLALRQGRGAVGRVGLGRLAMVIHRRCRCPYSMNTIYSL